MLKEHGERNAEVAKNGVTALSNTKYLFVRVDFMRSTMDPPFADNKNNNI